MEAISLKISNPNVHFKKGIETESKYTPEEKNKLAKASKDFESMLTSMMLKSMTKTTGGLFGKENYGGNVLDVVFETEISKFITDSKGMGVAEQLYRSITGEKFPDHLKLLKKKSGEYPVSVNKDYKIENNKYKNNALERLREYESFIEEASNKYGIDQKLIKSVILTESAAKKDARSKADAKGLMQLMDPTSADMGVKNPWDPKDNIFGGTKYLSKMIKDFNGDMDLALAAYNAGPGNVKKYGGIPPFKETMNYVNRVNNYLNSLE